MRKAVAKCTVTKIHGQPTNQDIDRLDEELTAIASSFPSELGGGLHGHTGLVKSIADYDAFALAHLLFLHQIQDITHKEIFQQHNADNVRQSTRHSLHSSRHPWESAMG